MASKFHGTHAWQRLRARIRIEADFTCSECGERGERKGDLHIHHVMDVRHYPAVKLDPANLRALCSRCHNREEPRSVEPLRVRKGADGDGFPLDPRHPWNVLRGR